MKENRAEALRWLKQAENDLEAEVSKKIVKLARDELPSD